ncbi:MAG TPA: hypothetical protein DHW61_03955 [Lachnoclostridium phytofermentans]|uniref:Uncharacterized protein n=1 Tax=Lachnoclostridium phytofermentans TaxID=66219 RepID=A0A3D2X341_9FIRM|nr:hypothetical protein [Lachnoclostridium phytofermentans]
MKKINSIGYAHKIIGLAGLFLAIIPLCCHIFKLIFHAVLFSMFLYISLAIGFLVLLFFIGLLAAEFHQDKKIDRQYIDIWKTKLSLGNGFYECQSCGNRKVNSTDKSCRVCGTTFNTGRRNLI